MFHNVHAYSTEIPVNRVDTIKASAGGRFRFKNTTREDLETVPLNFAGSATDKYRRECKQQGRSVVTKVEGGVGSSKRGED